MRSYDIPACTSCNFCMDVYQQRPTRATVAETGIDMVPRLIIGTSTNCVSVYRHPQERPWRPCIETLHDVHEDPTHIA